MPKISQIINTVFTSKSYIIQKDDSTEVFLVDCGDVSPILQYLSDYEDRKVRVKGVLFTHIHYDHIYGLPQMAVLFPQAKVYTNEFGIKALADERLNYSRYHGDSIVFTSDRIVVCKEGMKIKLFDEVYAKVYYTPGHNPSCLTYEVGDYLFTGDSYIPGVKVVTNLRGGDKQQALDSEKRIKSLAEGKVICPGHKVDGILVEKVECL